MLPNLLRYSSVSQPASAASKEVDAVLDAAFPVVLPIVDDYAHGNDLDAEPNLDDDLLARLGL